MLQLKEVFRVLALGDVSRGAACDYLTEHLWKFRREKNISLVILNGENSAEENGISYKSAKQLFSAGADVITTGNHAFRRYEAKKLFEEETMILRPGNFPAQVPGDGAVVIKIDGMRVLVFNLLGVVMMEPLENPFFAADRILKRYEGIYDVAVLDFHAEATSEKQALAYYLDGKIQLFFGTHTHVATADERILPNGTAYITDVGMCGPENSVIGIDPACIIEKLTTGLPIKFIPAENRIHANGIVVDIDRETKKAISIERIEF